MSVEGGTADGVKTEGDVELELSAELRPGSGTISESEFTKCAASSLSSEEDDATGTSLLLSSADVSEGMFPWSILGSKPAATDPECWRTMSELTEKQLSQTLL